MKLEQVRQDDINGWVGGLLDSIAAEVPGYVESTDKEDELFNELSAVLNKFFNYPDYKNYN